jgi:hypothetical protein
LGVGDIFIFLEWPTTNALTFGQAFLSNTNKS